MTYGHSVAGAPASELQDLGGRQPVAALAGALHMLAPLRRHPAQKAGPALARWLPDLPAAARAWGPLKQRMTFDDAQMHHNRSDYTPTAGLGVQSITPSCGVPQHPLTTRFLIASLLQPPKQP